MAKENKKIWSKKRAKTSDVKPRFKRVQIEKEEKNVVDLNNIKKSKPRSNKKNSDLNKKKLNLVRGACKHILKSSPQVEQYGKVERGLT